MLLKSGTRLYNTIVCFQYTTIYGYCTLQFLINKRHRSIMLLTGGVIFVAHNYKIIGSSDPDRSKLLPICSNCNHIDAQYLCRWYRNRDCKYEFCVCIGHLTIPCRVVNNIYLMIGPVIITYDKYMLLCPVFE